LDGGDGERVPGRARLNSPPVAQVLAAVTPVVAVTAVVLAVPEVLAAVAPVVAWRP
jgi:hypothetical protein